MSRGIIGDRKVNDDLLKKGITSFLGAWLLFHEKADDAIRAMIGRSRGRSEGERDFTERLAIEVDSEKEVLKEKLEGTFADAMRTARKDEIERIEERLAAIEERLRNLETRG
ncbi:MAG: hypothetical protein M1548_07020 [Actinobacteria bacterium]|nr:hypothetical protein [Actinomycetota bacterium]